MLEVLSQFVSSKKFMASFGATVTIVAIKLAGKFGLVLDPATADEISKIVCVIVSTYVVAQGIADHGKEAAKITQTQAVEQAVDAGAKVLVEDATGKA